MVLLSPARLLLALSLLSSSSACSRVEARTKVREQEAHDARDTDLKLPTLAAADLLTPGAALEPSVKARALAEQRVRLVGFMAELELASADALYLVPRPVHCDEAGGGTADLPPDAVLLTLPAPTPRPLEHVAGPIEAVGVLEVGNRTDAHGRVSNFRLRLDRESVQRAL